MATCLEALASEALLSPRVSVQFCLAANKLRCSALIWHPQAYTPRRLMALWHAGTAAQALGWLRLRAAGSALLFGRILDAGVELPVSRC